ncbi:CRAL_TRIO_N domain-containing protein, partial [Caerostris extrusa]
SLNDIHPCLEEDFLLRFLRIAKFDHTKALQKILKFYQHQDKLAEVFSKFSMSLLKAGSLNHIWVSPYRLENNSLLVIALGVVLAPQRQLEDFALARTCRHPSRAIWREVEAEFHDKPFREDSRTGRALPPADAI